MKTGLLTLDNMTDVVWHAWDDLEPLHEHAMRYVTPPICLVHYPYSHQSSSNGIMIMIFNFSEFKWNFPLYDPSWESASLEAHEISFWATLPQTPDNWKEDCDIESHLLVMDKWLIESNLRKIKSEDLKSRYSHN